MSNIAERLRTIRLAGTKGSTIRQAADRIETLESNLAAAISEATKQARETGEAKGRLEASEIAGVVEGWQRKCERLEAALRQCVDALLSGWTIAQAIARQALEQNQ